MSLDTLIASRDDVMGGPSNEILDHRPLANVGEFSGCNDARIIAHHGTLPADSTATSLPALSTSAVTCAGALSHRHRPTRHAFPERRGLFAEDLLDESEPKM